MSELATARPLASHRGPESCGHGREDIPKALTVTQERTSRGFAPDGSSTSRMTASMESWRAALSAG